MANEDESYTFPWGFHLGDLHKADESIPLYTGSNDGGFCLLYDKVSEPKADKLLESLCLEMLASMPNKSLEVDLFDFGKKKFYHLSPLKYIEILKTAYTPEIMLKLFERLEKIIVSRHTDLLCCNRPTIDVHNEKSKMKQKYHLVLINLENFPTDDIELRRIQNFVESASTAGVYVIAFGNLEIEKSESKTVQSILNHFKKLHVREGEFEITKEVFEFVELLEDHSFESLDIDKARLMEKVLTNANLEMLLDPANLRLETDTKVK